MQITEQQPQAETTTFGWKAQSNIAKMAFKNFGLQLLTLGFYYFWGKVEARQKIWSSVRIAGQPLEYSGTGKELFVSFLISYFIIFGPLFFLFELIDVAITARFGAENNYVFWGSIAFYTLFTFYFSGVAQYRARQYRLKRTCWRGIYGHMTGSAWRYGWIYLWTMVLLLASAFLLMPWRDLKLRKIMTENTHFGEEPLQFKASLDELLPTFVMTWIILFLLASPFLFVLGKWAYPWMAAAIIGSLTLLRPWHYFSRDSAATLKTWLYFSLPRLVKDKASQLSPRTKMVVVASTVLVLSLYILWIFNSASLALLLKLTLKKMIKPGPLMIVVLILLFSFIGTAISLIFTTYYSRLYNLCARATLFQGHPFALKTSPWGLFVLTATNFLLALLSLGALMPLVLARSTNYFISRLEVGGTLDYSKIIQSEVSLKASGEGFAEAFDVNNF